MPRYTILPSNPTQVQFISQSMAISALHAGSIPWSKLIRMLVRIIRMKMSDGGLPPQKLFLTYSCIQCAFLQLNNTNLIDQQCYQTQVLCGSLNYVVGLNICLYLLFEIQMETQQVLLHPYASTNIKKADLKSTLYDTIEIPWGQLQQFTIAQKIGRGRYSHVFQGKNVKTKERVAIKVLLPISPTKIKREYHILKSLNHPNIIKIVDIVKCAHLKTASIITEHFQHDDFRELYPKLSLPDIKFYLKQLLETLDYVHSQGIMHRDIKPFNILINHQKRKLKLIDFGLSQYYYPTKENNTKVASAYYKAPELYFSNTQYDYRVDCWAVGMIMAGMIFKKTPFLVGNDQIDQILKLTKLLGAKEVVNYIKENKLSERRGHRRDNICFDILLAFENGDIKAEEPSDYSEFVNKTNQDNATLQAIDLLKKLLRLDYKKRFTAKQALEHPFFDGV